MSAHLAPPRTGSAAPTSRSNRALETGSGKPPTRKQAAQAEKIFAEQENSASAANAEASRRLLVRGSLDTFEGMEPSAASHSMAPLLAVRNLEVRASGISTPLLDVTGFDLGAGEVVGIVGAPGAGKTVLARTIMRLLPPNLAIERGSIQLHAEELTAASHGRLDQLRGRVLSMIFQSPEQALDPLRTCFAQLAEPFRGLRLDKADLTARFAERLGSLGFSDPERILRSRPAALSGGERQRVLLALATAQAPALLLADEPTSGFDPDLQSEFVREIRTRAGAGLSTLLISHDRKMIEASADRIIRMDAGRLVESDGGVAAAPRRLAPREMGGLLLEVSDLCIRRGRTEVVRNLSFRADTGRALGVVGASGSGKTSLARVLAGLLPASGGSVVLHATRPRRHPQPVQLIYQDPSSSLNPSMTIREAVREPMLLRGLTPDQSDDQLAELLARVGIGGEQAERRPGELSGGQRQLAAIARALAADPALLVLDEPTASLSENAAGAVLDLLRGLLEEHRLGAVLISHDIELVHAFCDTVVSLDARGRNDAEAAVPQAAG